jgi:hypothetical protein
MKSLRALFSNMLVLGTTSQGNKTYPRILIHIEDSRLSFLRLSFAFLLIGVFWMVVQLDQYVVWWRSGEKALLLVAVIVSTILICINDRMYSDLRYKKERNRTAILDSNLIPADDACDTSDVFDDFRAASDHPPHGMARSFA